MSFNEIEMNKNILEKKLLKTKITKLTHFQSFFFVFKVTNGLLISVSKFFKFSEINEVQD